MTIRPKKTYWFSPADRDSTIDPAPANSLVDERQNHSWGHGDRATISRRQFLEAAGFSVSLAALGGCRRAGEETARPFITQPVGRVAGRASAYASTLAGCTAGCGLLVTVRDGRPLKMEGMPDHPLSRGGLCAVGQALPLGLYDRHRLAHPVSHGQPAAWNDVDEAIMAKLDELAGSDAVVRFVTPSVSSPTLRAAIARFLDASPMLATSPSTPSVARPFSMRTSTRMENAYCPISNSRKHK